MSKKFVFTALSIVSLFFTALAPINQAAAATYVTVSIKFSDESGNIPLDSSYARVSTESGESVANAEYKNQFEERTEF